MKKHILTLMACAAMLLVACKPNEPVKIQQEQFIGLWGMSTSKQASASGLYDEYLNLHADGTLEYYSLTEPDYCYHRGTFHTDENMLVIFFKQFRVFQQVDNILRYIYDYNASDRWQRGVMTVTDITEDIISTQSQTTNIYLHRVEALTPAWEDMMSAPEIEISESNLIAQWDLLSLYQLGNDNYTWWYTYYPEKTGITLNTGNSISDCYFLVNMVTQTLQAAGEFASDEQAYLEWTDCPWYFSNDSVILTCKRYTAQKFDKQGNVTAERTVTPETPLVLRYKVHMLSDYHLILFSPSERMYYAFYRHNSDKSEKMAQKKPENLQIRKKSCIFVPAFCKGVPRGAHE